MDIQYPLTWSTCACPSLPRLAASVVDFTTLIVALIHSLQLLAYVYFTVATTPHLLEASTCYHILFHKPIYWYVAKVLH